MLLRLLQVILREMDLQLPALYSQPLSIMIKTRNRIHHLPLNQPASPLSLTRLIVITTRLTASASEAVMNGLKPFLNVVSIGDTTNGKPVGMNGWEVGEKYFFWPITFKIVNKNNEGDYFDGIAPGKVIADDITHDFDDRNELCLKEAIHYLETGSFSTKGFTRFYRHPQYSERPEWMSNGLLLKINYRLLIKAA